MSNELDQVETIDTTDLSDPDSLRVQDFDIRNSVFVIPVDAPVPSELSDIQVPQGTLYDRLAALNEKTITEFAFVPLSGAELLALERAWRSLQVATRVFALFDLPGARYDIMFTQSVRQIGIRRVDWSAVADSMASRVRTVQRTKDASPWQMKGQDLTQGRKPRAPRLASADVMPAAPTDEGPDADS